MGLSALRRHLDRAPRGGVRRTSGVAVRGRRPTATRLTGSRYPLAATPLDATRGRCGHRDEMDLRRQFDAVVHIDHTIALHLH